MRISKEELQHEANASGFRIELLEKVLLLMRVLSDLSSFPQLKDKLVLKGGTALNLFFFGLPRLSVDIDLNYIGNIDRQAMLSERSFILSSIISICERAGLTLVRNPGMHAGGKMVWKYSSVLGHKGNIEIDINFMYRIPLWPIEYKSSCLVGSEQIHNIPVLDIHELSAGKLCALIDRKTGRDLFDAHYLLNKMDIDFEKLRLSLILYSCMSQSIDLRKITPQDINVDQNDLKKRLIPLLNKGEVRKTTSIMTWSDDLVRSCQEGFQRLLPLKSQENDFLKNFLQNGNIEPELITNDAILKDIIQVHPAIQWRLLNIIRNK